MSCENSIISGIEKDCKNINASIGAEKDLILINYKDFDKLATKSPFNRQLDNDLGNKGGLTDIKLVPDAIQYVFEGTDYSVIPNVSPEVREDGSVWYTHSISFTVYSKSAETRETLQSLSKAKVIAVTKDRSTGLFELFGMEVGLKVTGTERAYTGAQSSNFYTVTIATPEIAVIRENSLGELSLQLDGVSSGAPIPDQELNLAELLFLKEDKAKKGVANGYAPLGSNTKVPAAYLDIVDGFEGGVDKILSANAGELLYNTMNLGLNNVKREIIITTPTIASRAEFANIINSLPPFQINSYDIPYFVTTTAEGANGYKIELIEAGKGNYGDGFNQISPTQIRITALGVVTSGTIPTFQQTLEIDSSATVETSILISASKNGKTSTIEIIPDVDTIADVGINVNSAARVDISGKAISLNTALDGNIEFNTSGTGKVLINSSEIVNKEYVDAKVIGLFNDRGSYNASSNTFPFNGGSGVGGAILRGDTWWLSAGGTLGGINAPANSNIRALIDSPTQNLSDWNILGAIIIPEATETIKGIIQLTGDLGGTSASPTTPTAIHKNGDEVKNGKLTVTEIIRNGGLSTQFLKADGSVDGSTYLTAASSVISNKEDKSNKTSTVLGNEASTSLYLNIAGAVDYFQQKLNNITLGLLIFALSSKTTPVDADQFIIMDSENSNIAKKTSWANIKSMFNSIYITLATSQTISGVKTFLDGNFGMRNSLNTFTSFFTNSNTASRIYTLQNRDGTLLDNTDLTNINSSIALKQDKDNQIEINSSMDVQNSWNGQTILFTSSCTINVPNTLNSSLMFPFRTLTGVNVTWAIATPFFWETVPTTIPEKTVGNFMRRGGTNTIILDY